VKYLVKYVLGHRLVISNGDGAHDSDPYKIIDNIIGEIKVPMENLQPKEGNK
jgi:hypothetical protein